MTQAPNPLVPATNWGAEAEQFAQGMGRQALLCYSCVLMGLPVPPVQVVIADGKSFCLDHLPRPEVTP